MRILIPVGLALFTFVTSPVFAACHAQNETWASFSDTALTMKDKFFVSITGENCDNLIQTIRIETANGKPLYQHESAFIDGTREQISQEFIEFIVQFTLHENFFHLTSDLPEWSTLEQNADLQHLFVTQQDYLTLKNQPWPLFSHQSDKDRFVTLVFDRSNDQIIKVMEGRAEW